MLLKNLWGLPNMLGVCHFIVIRVAKNWNFLRQKYKNLNIFYKTYLKVQVLRYTFFKRKRWFLIFLKFLTNFGKINSQFLKKRKNTFTHSFPQTNFTIGLVFLAICHRLWVCWGLWKIAKPFKNCTRWSVKLVVYFFGGRKK